MKDTWNLIEKTVKASLLSEEEQKNVLEQLDYVLGSYLIESVYPIFRGDLTENEFVVYKQILEALNPPRVSNDITYSAAIDILLGKHPFPNKRVQEMLEYMDAMYVAKDWEQVNATIQQIWSL